MFEGLMDGLSELFGKLFDELMQFTEIVKRIIARCDNQRKQRLANRKGWDKPAHLDPSGPKEATQANSVEALMRWHTAVTGE